MKKIGILILLTAFVGSAALFAQAASPAPTATPAAKTATTVAPAAKATATPAAKTEKKAAKVESKKAEGVFVSFKDDSLVATVDQKDLTFTVAAKLTAKKAGKKVAFNTLKAGDKLSLVYTEDKDVLTLKSATVAK